MAFNIWAALLALTLAIALMRGGGDERRTALVLTLAATATIVHHLLPWRLDALSIVLDLSLLAFLFAQAMISTRWWPLYACAAQLGTCIGLLAYAMNIRPLILAYHIDAVVWSYGLLAALLVGTLMEQDARSSSA